MVRDFRDHLDLGPCARQDERVHAFEVGCDEIRERLDACAFAARLFKRYDNSQWALHFGWPGTICGPQGREQGQNGRGDPEGVAVKELVRSNDMVLLSFIRSLLDGAGIPYVVLDGHMSVIEGSLGVLPRRVMVGEDRLLAARRILEDNGLGHELRDAGR